MKKKPKTVSHRQAMNELKRLEVEFRKDHKKLAELNAEVRRGSKRIR